MDDVKALDPQYLSNRCDPDVFIFTSTEQLVESTPFIGQRRAYEAIQFGIRIKQDGYNLYALGSDDIGKKEIVETILKEEAIKRSTPSDWCYVFNFKDPRCPRALQLPAGMGVELRSRMEQLIENLKSTLPAFFETAEHQARIRKINEEVIVKQKKYFEALQAEAEKNDMTILSTSKGFVVVSIRGGKVLTEKELQLLSDTEREHTEEVTEELSGQLTNVINQIQKLHKKRRKHERQYEREFTLNAVSKLINKIKKKFNKLPKVLQYLEEVQEDVVSNVKIFLKEDNEPPAQVMWGESHPSEFAFSRYEVNVVVNNAKTEGAPVIYEDNTRYYRLFGRIEHVSQFGALVTDFTLIQEGSLHRANGGYLIINVKKILAQTSSWESLKRALFSKELKIELPPNRISVTSTSILEPQPIPLDIKIILLGNREDYYSLRDTDAEFNELFKVSVDFEDTIKRDQNTMHLYARLIAMQVRQRKLYPFDKTAVARVIDYSSRIIEDSEKMSLHMHSLTNLLEEADHWTREAGNFIVTGYEVQKAINFQKFRLDHYQQLLYEEIQRNIIFINAVGTEVGQINALSTYRLGDFTFGAPSRVTVTTRMGRDGIIDIEKEVKLGGPIHAKGVLILSGFLKSHYAQQWPLTLSASIVFEQSYGSVEGDSASVAELCTLLSSLSQIPIKQSIGVTGSVNQHGLVQAIGCANEKIEGFFDICRERGLTGEQGVIIPKSNVSTLMLRDDVIEAAQKKLFHIYAIETIEEAIFVLLGRPAGQRDIQGNFPVDTVNYLVDKKLEEFARINKKWTKDYNYSPTRK